MTEIETDYNLEVIREIVWNIRFSENLDKKIL